MTKARNIADLGSNDVIETTATGVDVTGTVTADGLVVENNTTDVKGLIKNTLTGGSRTATLDIVPQNDGAYGLSIQTSGGSGTGTFKFNNKNTMKFDFNNDVHFYEDTGTTAKFVWDASAESLILKGNDLDLNNGTALHRITNDNTNLLIRADYGNTNANSTIQFSLDGTERMRIDSAGAMMIGGTSKLSPVTLDTGFYVESTTNNGKAGVAYSVNEGSNYYRSASYLDDATGYHSHDITYSSGNAGYLWKIVGSEKARLDSSGNLLVGTSTSPAGSGGLSVRNRFTVGYQGVLNGYGAENYSGLFYSGGNNAGFTAINSNSGNGCLYLSRTASAPNGLMLSFASNGSQVGAINSRSGLLQIGKGDIGLEFHDADNTIYPAHITNNTLTNNTANLGGSAFRFKDMHLGGIFYGTGTYANTSGGSANVGVAADGAFYRSTSSLRYKTDVQDAQHGLTEVMTLRPVTYRGINDGDTVFGGLIAEEVHEAGLTEFVEYNEDNEPDALAYANMVSLCIKAIQEQQEIIENLKTRIETLENN